MAITKLEQNCIRAFIHRHTDKTGHYIAADRNNIVITHDVNQMLEMYVRDYRRIHNNKTGKSKMLHEYLLSFFAQEQAIASMEKVDLEACRKSTQTALQAFKRIMNQYVDDSIKNVNHAIISILIWTTIRNWELSEGKLTTDYRDASYEDGIETDSKLEPDIPDISALSKKEIKKVIQTEQVQPPVAKEEEISLEDLYE